YRDWSSDVCSSDLDVVQELILRPQNFGHFMRKLNHGRVRHRAVQVAESQSLNRVAGRDHAVLHENVQVLQRAGAFVLVQLTNPPVAVRVDFDQEGAVDVVKLSDHTLALLDVVALRDGAGGVVQLDAFALHCWNRAHSQLGVRENGGGAAGVRFESGQGIDVRRQRVVLTGPHET